MRSLRVVVFGRTKTGKTQLVSRYVGLGFTEEYEPTVEELYEHRASHAGRSVEMRVLDTQGLESFKALRDLYIAGAEACLLVYSLSDSHSLSGFDELIEDIRAQKHNTPFPMALVGTHTDTLSGNAGRDALKAAQHLADTYHIAHILTSAKTGARIYEPFEELVKQKLAFQPHFFDTESLSSTSSVESWLCTPRELRARHAASQPALKRSFIKLKKSVSNLQESRSIRNLRSFMSLRSTDEKKFGDQTVDNLGGLMTLDDIPRINEAPARTHKHGRCVVM